MLQLKLISKNLAIKRYKRINIPHTCTYTYIQYTHKYVDIDIHI